MQAHFLLLVALASAAPLLSDSPAAGDPQVRNGTVVWFAPGESMEQVARVMGAPAVVADFGQDLQSWQYQSGDIDRHEFSHQFVFRKSGRTLVSVTRNYEAARNVDAFFPEAETSVHRYPNAKEPQYSLRLRRLNDNSVLLAPGVSEAGQPAQQLMLVRTSDLRVFYPWLFEQLKNSQQLQSGGRRSASLRNRP